MGIAAKINKARMGLMRRMASNIGSSRIKKGHPLHDASQIKRVLISRPNGRLGNLLLTTPIIQEVAATFPNCKIDLFVKGGIAPTIFKRYKNVDHIIQLPKKPFKSLLKYAYAWLSIKGKRYDIVINVVSYSSSGRLSTKFASSKYKFFGEVDQAVQLRYKDHQHIAKHPVYSFRNYLAQLGFIQKDRPVPKLNLKLSDSEVSKGKTALKKLVNNTKGTICLFTYATGSKCHSESWWEEFYTKLKKEYPDYNIIEVLPMENVSQIGFRAPSFYSKNIRKIGALIANTKVFIGADSGIMHLASAVHTPTVGLFSVSNPRIYKPYNKNSVAIDTANTTIDKCLEAVNKILIATKTTTRRTASGDLL